MAVSKPMHTEFGIHHRLESCVGSPSLTLHSFVFLDTKDTIIGGPFEKRRQYYILILPS